jgi:hypothetical protein
MFFAEAKGKKKSKTGSSAMMWPLSLLNIVVHSCGSRAQENSRSVKAPKTVKDVHKPHVHPAKRASRF